MSANARNIRTTREQLAALRASPAARQRANLADKIATVVMALAALLLVIVLVSVIFILLRAGLPAISWQFLTSAGSLAQEGSGIGPQIFVSVYMLILSLLITTP